MAECDVLILQYLRTLPEATAFPLFMQHNSSVAALSEPLYDNSTVHC